MLTNFKIRIVKIWQRKRLSKMSKTKMFVSSSKKKRIKWARMCVCVCCDNGKEEKSAKCIVFSFFSLSLSVSPSPVFFCFSFSLLLYARNREDILIERERRKKRKEKKRKRYISIQQKHNTTMLLLFTAYRPTRPTLSPFAEKRTRLWMSCVHTSAAEREEKKKKKNKQRNTLAKTQHK